MLYNDSSKAKIVCSFNSDVELMETYDDQSADESSDSANAMADWECEKDFHENSKIRVSTGVAVD